VDGPVVKAAQKALETGNVNLVLIWVRKNDGGEIKNAFQKTLAVRKLGLQAKELSGMYFFETLVRVHRAAEGEPYTGLKPAGRDLGPAIPTADNALESGKLELLLKLLTESIQAEVREKFKHALAKKKYRADDVDRGGHMLKPMYLSSAILSKFMRRSRVRQAVICITLRGKQRIDSRQPPSETSP